MTFPAYPQYKDSGAEWLGEIPQHWKIFLAKRLFRNARDTAQSGSEQLAATQAYGVIPQKDFMEKNDVKVVLALAGTQNFKGVLADDFVISLRSFQGGIEHSAYDGCVSPAYTVLRRNTENDVYQGLFKYLLKEDAYISALQSVTTGIREGKTITYDQFGSLLLPVAASSEQTQIARFLDHETARIDALIEEQRRLIELLKEKRQAVISHIVTKGLDPTVPMKYSGVEWLGEVPAHWAIKRLKQLVLDAAGIQMGPFGGMLVDLDDSDTGYKVYGQENTISGNFSSGNRWVPESRYFALSNYHLEVGDIVLTRKGSLGNCRRVSLLPQAGIIDSDTIRVRVQDQMMNPDYLELLLHEAGYISTQLSLVKRGAILSGLNSEIIANLVIVVPPPDGQEELLLEIKAASSKFDQGISDCEYAVGLLRERRSALISAAVTGKIDVRGWQPPASVQAPELAQEVV